MCETIGNSHNKCENIYVLYRLLVPGYTNEAPAGGHMADFPEEASRLIVIADHSILHGKKID